ncbi:hypothetical protein ACFOG5_24315 [Pedobacter fastidiosus]|uniref:Uncharacterized protein n=1 Tax=Pedobacter fastidiosus TaxID=2765361 RepID=A0ABR7KX65_9SPHI|nr:hypothetical protein [Pedobacter fastidiosus]MBC6112709.1 hypothetical protein [Pedobacter fastidiosus]
MIAKRISIALFCYFLFFRLYAVCALFYSFIIQASNENLIRKTNDGFQLTIFQLEFYFFLIVIYGFRPSRFNKTIIKSYRVDEPKKLSKKAFFWTVYFGVLLVVFGIPFMIFKSALAGVLDILTGANQYILENTGLLFMSVIFLVLNVLGFYYNSTGAFGHAKIQFFRSLFALLLTVPFAVFLYLISMLFHTNASVLIILCLAFNLSFLWLSISGYWKSRKLVGDR